MPDKKKAKHIYFVGIGGASLNGLAQVLATRGFKVSGSDAQPSVVTEMLQAKGIVVHHQQVASNITNEIDEVVISSAVTNGPGAVEVAAAEALGIPVHKRTIWWSRLMSEAKVAIAVAGSHGKTSTTAMIGQILQAAGLKPTVLVGGEVADFGGTVLVGESDYLVVEADEYDHAFYACRPTISVITNIDYDHPDTYPTKKEYTQAFRRFARLAAKRKGVIIACGDDGETRKALSNIHSPLYWYGQRNRVPGTISTIPGEHMLLNAQAAAKAAHEAGVSWPIIKRALRNFKGVKRRFTYLGEYRGMKIYDDFAHHPKEIQAVLQTAKKMTKRPIAVVFQPHQKIRTKLFAQEFATVLSQADKAVLLPLYGVLGREEASDISSETISANNTALKVIQPEELKNWLQEAAKECDLLLNIGAGNSDQLMKSLLQELTDE